MRSLTAVLTAALVLLPAMPAWAANQPPVAVDDTVSYRNTGGIDYVVDALANDSDPDGDPLTYTAVTPAAKGNAYLRDGKLFYKPYLWNTGFDSFTYTVTDGQGNTATGTVTATLWVDPDLPGGVAISSTAPASVTLSWSAAARAAEYRVYRDGRLVGSTADLSWTDTGLLDTVRYGYQISSVNGGGYEAIWWYATRLYREARLSTPTGLAVEVADDATALNLTWSAGGQLGPWNLYRDGTLLTSTSTPSYTDTGLVTGREYSYQVQHAVPSSSSHVHLPSALSAAVRGTPDALTDIGQLFRELGSSAGALGPVTVAERAISGGRQQDHQNGLILQQDGETALAVTDPVATAYRTTGGATGYLGFPVAAQENGLRYGGSGQLFEGGSIWNTGLDRTWVVPWMIEDGWAAAGWEDGPLGWPAAAAVCGLRQDGCAQRFEGGWIHWSHTTGAQVTTGAILAAWSRQGGQNSQLGYPTAAAVCGLRGGGCAQRFEGGWIHWSPTTGAQTTTGTILTTWSRQGGQNGPLGYPTAAAVCGLRGGGCAQRFQGGWIHWSPTTGAQTTTGTILTTWSRQGGQNGPLGYPTAAAVCGLRGGGCAQRFQGGWIHWSPTTGAQTTTGTILTTWSRQGGQNGRLGYPTAGMTAAGGGVRQAFEGGSIAVDLRSGRVTVTYR